MAPSQLYKIAGFVTISFCAGFLFSFPAHAQTQGEIMSGPIQNPAEVYVDGVAVDNLPLSQGEAISGSVILRNARPTPVSDLYYVAIVMDKDRKVYDQTEFGPVTLNSNQKQTLPFSYVPKNVPGGKYTLMVRAILGSGFKMGWKETPLTIVSTQATAAQLEVVKASIKTEDREWSPQEGPTIYPDAPGTYVLTLKNPGTVSATVSAIVSLYKKDILGDAIKTLTIPAITIAKNQTGSFSVALPTDLDPNVYVGKVSIIDASSTERLPFVSFRYIAGGDIVTIQSITTTQPKLEKNNDIDLTVTYTGTPPDLTERRVLPPLSETEVVVKVFNEKDDVLAERRENVTLSRTGGTYTTSLTPTKSAEGFSAEVTISKNGKVLATQKTVLAIPTEKDWTGTGAALIILIALIFFGFLGFIAWKLFKKIRHARNIPPAAGPLLLALSLVGAGYLFFPQSTHAFTVTNSFNVSRTIFTGTDWRPNVFVNGPSGALQPGEHFFLTMDVEILACHNKPSYVSFMATDINGNPNVDMQNLGTITRGAESSVEHYSYSYTDSVTCGLYSGGKCVSAGSVESKGEEFVAPDAPGTYRIYIRVLNDPRISTAHIPTADNPDVWAGNYLPTDNELNYGWVEGYQEFTVAAPAPSSNFDLKVERVNSDGAIENPSTIPATEVRIGPFSREGGHWTFDNSEGLDLTGNGGNITLPTDTLNSNGNIHITVDHVPLNDYLLRGASAGTISMRVKWNGMQPCTPTNSTCGTAFARQLQGSGSAEALISLDNSDPNEAHITWQPFGFDGTNALLTSQTIAGNGQWHTVTATFGPDGIRLYIDGNLEAETISDGYQMSPNVGDIFLGGFNDPEYYAVNDTYGPFSDINVDELYVTPLGNGELDFTPGWVGKNPAIFTNVVAPGTGFYEYTVYVRPNLLKDYTLTAGTCFYNRSYASDCTVPNYNVSSLYCGEAYCTVKVTAYGPEYTPQASSVNVRSYPNYGTKIAFKYVKKPTQPGTKFCNLIINGGQGWYGDYFSWPSNYEANWPLPWWDRGQNNWTNTSNPSNPQAANFYGYYNEDGVHVNNNWYNTSGEYYSFSKYEPDLIKTTSFYPFGVNGQDFSFGAHWSATVATSTAGTYTYQFFNTDDDVWMYVNGVLQTFSGEPRAGSPGIKNYTSHTGSITLQANVPKTIDIYYAQRAPLGSGFNFIFNTDNFDGNTSTSDCVQPARKLIVRRVGNSGSQADAPTNGTIKINGVTYASTTENVDALALGGTYTVSASTATGYNVYVGTCSQAFGLSAECALSQNALVAATCANGFCSPPASMPINVADNIETKVVFKYVPIVPVTADIKSNDSDQPDPLPVPATYPVSWTSGGITAGDGTCSVKDRANPGTELNTSLALNGTISVTTSSIPSGGTITYDLLCTRTSDGATSSDSVIARFESATISSASCKPTTLTSPVADPATTALVGQPVTWVVTDPVGAGYSYEWSWDGGTTYTSPTASVSTSKTYNTIGKKTAYLRVTRSSDGATVTSTCSIQPIIKLNPIWKQF